VRALVLSIDLPYKVLIKIISEPVFLDIKAQTQVSKWLPACGITPPSAADRPESTPSYTLACPGPRNNRADGRRCRCRFPGTSHDKQGIIAEVFLGVPRVCLITALAFELEVHQYSRERALWIAHTVQIICVRKIHE